MITTTYFVDPHGTPDEGGTEVSIVNKKKYKDDVYYQYEEVVEEDGELQGSEDGYNAEAEVHTYIELTDKQAVKAEKIIKSYKLLLEGKI